MNKSFFLWIRGKWNENEKIEHVLNEFSSVRILIYFWIVICSYILNELKIIIEYFFFIIWIDV